MKLKNLRKDNPNYERDYSLYSSYNGNIADPKNIGVTDAENHEFAVELQTQLIIKRRLQIVIRSTPEDVLSFAQQEIRTINRLLEGSLNREEVFRFHAMLGVSPFRAIKQYPLKEEVIGRYKKYLLEFIEDDCVLEKEDDERKLESNEILYREIFPQLISLYDNIIIIYEHTTRVFQNESTNDYTIISLSGCTSTEEFKKKVARCIKEGITNLKTTLRKKNVDAQRLLDYVKDRVTDFDEIDEDYHWHIFKFIGTIGWQVALNVDIQYAIIRKTLLFMSIWNNCISELQQKLLIIEDGHLSNVMVPADVKPKLSFNYISTDREGEISIMYESLKKNELIHKKTTKPMFRTAFVMKQISQKVVWIGGINTLSYFIKHLVQKNRIEKRVDYWQIAQTCFSNDEETFTPEQLKQAKKPGMKIVAKIDRLLDSL